MQRKPSKWAQRINKKIDPVIFYLVHYPGYTRGQLDVEDHSLCQLLRRNELLDHVPFALPYRPNPIQYYHQNYPGLTRGQLQSTPKGKAFYEYMRRNDMLGEIPIKKYHI